MKPTTKSHLFIATAFIAATIIISIFLPREKVINLDFTEGKPWKYEQLNSPFSFAVYKSEQTLQHERAKVLAEQRPYYKLEGDKAAEAINTFDTIFQRELHLLMGNKLKQKISLRLKAIYDNGIISSSDLAHLQADSISTIMLIKNNVAIARDLDELYTVQQAYEQIMKQRQNGGDAIRCKTVT